MNESVVSLESDENGFYNELKDCQLLWQRYQSLFEWSDGPLVEAMKNGDIFVLDEINLIEDAVIERLNIV